LNYLGINAFCHHSGATIVDESGVVLAAVEEERFSRKKGEDRFPGDAIRYCLGVSGDRTTELAGVAFGWSPHHLFFGRVLRSHLIEYPVGLATIGGTIGQLRNMLALRPRFVREIGPLHGDCRLMSYRHHVAHAASAYFSSPFDEAAFLTVDGRGERDSITWGIARGAHLKQLGAFHFPHSIGKLYSAICRYLGFDGVEKDGTVMALAAHGKPSLTKQFRQLASWKSDGGLGQFRLNVNYFDLADVAGPSKRMEYLFGMPARRRHDVLTDFHRDVAATLQHFVEETLISLTRRIHEITKLDRLVMAGGVALNSVANGLVVEHSGFRSVFVQPAAHDGGLSLGAAQLLVARKRIDKPDWRMQSAALGPEFSDTYIEREISKYPDVHVQKANDPARAAALRIASGEIVGWFQGRMEFGPRALGQRCLLADPRNAEIKNRLNRIKGRETFRPFAAAMLSEHRNKWLQAGAQSPFMLLVDHIRAELRNQVPGVLHVDNSVRVQTVEAATLPLFYSLIDEFYGLSQVPLVLSTSLNVNGEPIACTPSDAIRVLLETSIDALVIGPYLLTRR